MRWVVLGASGMLGTDLVDLLERRDQDVVGLDRPEADILDGPGTAERLAGAQVVVNCAAWTAVDDAETHEGEAFMVNAVGAGRVAQAAATVGARMVQVSTDYVFGGTASTPYGEDDPPAPRSAYGRTKLAGEWAVRAAAPDALVVRTAWLYGHGGPCFPRTIARVVAERGTAEVVDDQVGQPTWTVDVADLVERLVTAQVPAGTYHATASGLTSWYEFAQAVVATAGEDTQVVRPTTSAAFVRPAPRPAYSVLGHDALTRVGVAAIGDWRQRWETAGRSVLA